MNKTVDAFFNFNECAERYNPYNLAVYNFANGILLCGEVPRLRLKLLVTDRNFLVLFIHLKNKEVIGFAYFKDVGNVFNAGPGKIRYMSKAIETVNGYKRTEIGYPFNLAFNGIAYIYGSEESFFLSGLCSLAGVLFFLKNNALGSNYFLPSAVFLYLKSAKLKVLPSYLERSFT